MRTFSIISTFVLLLTSLGLVTPANAQWPQTTAHNPWSLEIGAKGYNRPGSDKSIPLITDSVTRATLFDDNAATRLGTAAAPEIKFNFQTRTGQELEFRSILANWEEDSGPFGGPNLESPFFPINPIDMTPVVPDLINIKHDANLYSFELMGRRAVRPGLVLMFGPRVVSTKDLIRYEAEKTVPTGGGSVPVLVKRKSETEATNILIGLQTGFEINRPITNGVYASSFMRVGGYYNPTEVTFNDTDSFLDTTVTNRLTKSTGSFLGEVGGRLYMDIVPNCFSGYVGYEANWIDGIALAPPQLLPNPLTIPAIDTSNTAFFHGVTFGLKFTY